MESAATHAAASPAFFMSKIMRDRLEMFLSTPNALQAHKSPS